MALTDVSIRNAQASSGHLKLFDGGGLYLLVKPNGSKLWRLKYRIDGHEKLLALGSYGDVTLKQTRDAREDARRLIAQGVDPSEQKKQEASATNTFEIVAQEYWHGGNASSNTHHPMRMIRNGADIFQSPWPYPWLDRLYFRPGMLRTSCRSLQRLR